MSRILSRDVLNYLKPGALIYNTTRIIGSKLPGPASESNNHIMIETLDEKIMLIIDGPRNTTELYNSSTYEDEEKIYEARVLLESGVVWITLEEGEFVVLE